MVPAVLAVPAVPAALVLVLAVRVHRRLLATTATVTDELAARLALHG